MRNPDLYIRRGTESDRPAIQLLMASQDMAADLDQDEFVVAVDEGEIIGALRKEQVEEYNFIRPIVAAAEWQKKGIGSALIYEAQTGLQELSVVARGQAIGFYLRLGFTSSDWNWLPKKLCQECELCPDWGVCRPSVMVWKRKEPEVF